MIANYIYNDFISPSSLDDDKLSDELLHVNAFGVINVLCYSETTTRPTGRLDYHMIIVLKGSMRVTIDGVDYDISPQNLIYYEPHTPQFYEYKVGSQFVWLHLTGTYAPEAMKQLGLTQSGVYPIQNIPYLQENSKEIITILRSFSFEQNFRLYRKLFRLLESIQYALSEETLIRNKRFEPVIRYMNENLSQQIDMQHCADLAALSLSWFHHTFKQEFHMSPAKYLENLRMIHAKSLLGNGEYNINQIANLCGYEDPLYFSRVFKKFYGSSPSAFKNGQ